MRSGGDLDAVFAEHVRALQGGRAHLAAHCNTDVSPSALGGCEEHQMLGQHPRFHSVRGRWRSSHQVVLADRTRDLLPD